MVGADGEGVRRRRPRLDLLVRAIEEWESILSGGGDGVGWDVAGASGEDGAFQ